MSMTAAERIEAYVSIGLDVYLDGTDVLRVRAASGMSEEAARRLVDAALPALRQHKDDLVEYLRNERASAVEMLTRVRLEPASIADDQGDSSRAVGGGGHAGVVGLDHGLELT